MNSSPVFSVIIPTYHRNDSLAKCLDCLAPGVQTLPPDRYEVIVTDDGSQTTAEEMLRERYPWAKWVAGPRKGPAANRNNGAKYAQGEWLVFTDDDCLPSALWLSAFDSAIVPDIQVYEGKTTCEAGICPLLEYAPINLTGGYLWSCNMMIRSKLFQALGGFDENFPYPHMEDVDFRERIKSSGHSFRFAENAVIDHPPKIAPFGKGMAILHESEIYYSHKRSSKITKTRFIYQLVKARFIFLRIHPLSRHSARTFLSLLVEVFYTLLYLRSWQKKYHM